MKKSEWIDAFESIQGRKPTPQEFQEAMERQEFVDEVDTHCPKCKTDNPTGSPFCPNCGTKMDGSVNRVLDSAAGITGSIADKINAFTGGDGQVELKMRDLFSQAFKSHTRSEAESIFACGSATTTPLPEDISKEWPKPWYFVRVFGVLALTTVALYLMYVNFNNFNMFPGLIFVSSLAGAIPVLFFYFECNSPRNIDIMSVIEIFFLGGVLSLLLTLIIGVIFPGGTGELIPSMTTGLVEEVGKVLATAYFIQKFKDKRYILNGLLIGGAVGAGFAVFETAGYVFQSALIPFNYEGVTTLLFNPNPTSPLSTAILRGFLAFGGHVAWAAVTGAGLMIVLKNQKVFSWSAIWSGESLRFLILVIILHGLWDMDFYSLPVDNQGNLIATVEQISHAQMIKYLQYGSLAILVWIIILVIINRGLKEINAITKESNTLRLNERGQ